MYVAKAILPCATRPLAGRRLSNIVSRRRVRRLWLLNSSAAGTNFQNQRYRRNRSVCPLSDRLSSDPLRSPTFAAGFLYRHPTYWEPQEHLELWSVFSYEGENMPYLASRHSPEPEPRSEPVKSHRGLIITIVTVLLAVVLVSVCIRSVVGA